jgi:hypothetical protein
MGHGNAGDDIEEESKTGQMNRDERKRLEYMQGTRNEERNGGGGEMTFSTHAGNCLVMGVD